MAKRKCRRKTKIFQAFLHSGQQRKDNLQKKPKLYIQRIFVINKKAGLVQLAECRKALFFTARGSNSPDLLAGRTQNLKKH